MAEKTLEVTLKLEKELQETVDKLEESVLEEDNNTTEEELKGRVVEIKSKMQQDNEDCMKLLDMVGHVEQKEDESLCESIFTLVVKDSVDSILRKEMAHPSMQIALFRNNISQKMLTDDTPLNVLDVPKGFFEAWKVWKEQAQNENQEELSYQALRALVIKQD